MTRRAGWSVVFLLAFPFPPPWAQDGKLQKVRTEEAAPAKSDKSPDCDDPEACAALGELFFNSAVETLYRMPRALLKDDGDTVRYFSPYPYAWHGPGHLLAVDGDLLRRVEPSQLRGLSGRVDVEGSSDFQGIDRVNGHLLLDTNVRFGFQGDWSYLTERLGAGRRDEMFLTDLNVVYRLAQNDRAEVRAGVGARLSTDRQATHGGFNLTYGIDVFPRQPWVVSTVFDVGSLGSAAVFHGRATVGVLLQRWEVFTGFDYLRIGSVDFYGPVAGVRLWF